MSRFVTFNGQTRYKPGAIFRVTPVGGVTIGAQATGTVALIGEAEDGEPDKLYIIDDPALGRSIFRSGPLADAIRDVFQPSADPRIPAGASRVLAYKVNQSTQSVIQLPGSAAIASGTITGAPTVTSIPITGFTTMAAHVGRWLSIGSERRRITAVDTGTSTYTVTPGFTSVPTLGAAVELLATQATVTSRRYGAATRDVSVEVEPGTTGVLATVSFEDLVERSPELGGVAYLRLKYAGGPVTVTGTITAATATTVSLDVTAAPLLDAYAGQIIRTPDGTQRLIASNTAADPTVITLAAGHELDAATIALINGSSADVVNVTSATVTVQGSAGQATGLTLTVAPTNDPVSLTFAAQGISTLRQLVTWLNANTNLDAEVPPGINPDTNLVAEFDFDATNTSIDVRFDDAVDPLDKGRLRADLQELVDWLNTFSELVTATRGAVDALDGAGLPQYTGGLAALARDVPLYLDGGIRGSSTNADWQAAFDRVLQERENKPWHLVPLISYDLSTEGDGSTATLSVVAAQFAAAVAAARTAAFSNELAGYMGMRGTIDELIAQARAFQDVDIQLTGQRMSSLSADGTQVVLQPEWSSAVKAAGMRAGMPSVKDSLTNRAVRTQQLTQDASWTPSDITAVNRLLQAGVLFAEPTVTGIVWVRDLNTWTRDDDSRNINGGVRTIIRYIVVDLRQVMTQRIGDTGGATVGDLQTLVSERLDNEYFQRLGIIVNSIDQDTGATIPGWRNLRITQTGNVANVRFECVPAPEQVFQLVDIGVLTANLAA